MDLVRKAYEKNMESLDALEEGKHYDDNDDDGDNEEYSKALENFIAVISI